MFRPFHHILKSTRNDMRYIQRYRMRTCSLRRATHKFHWKVNSVFTKHSLCQQLYPQLFHRVEIFQITPSICFTLQPFFGKAPSSFLTERKENITFGKYSFSLHSLHFHFFSFYSRVVLSLYLLDFNHVFRLLKHFGNPWLCSFFDQQDRRPTPLRPVLQARSQL